MLGIILEHNEHSTNFTTSINGNIIINSALPLACYVTLGNHL